MNHWPFIIAAYLIAGLGTFGVTLISYLAMRAAEQRIDDL